MDMGASFAEQGPQVCGHQIPAEEVLLAAIGVFGSGTGWPDFAVALIMAGLGVSGAWQIIRQAWAELGISYGPMTPNSTREAR